MWFESALTLSLNPGDEAGRKEKILLIREVLIEAKFLGLFCTDCETQDPLSVESTNA